MVSFIALKWNKTHPTIFPFSNTVNASPPVSCLSQYPISISPYYMYKTRDKAAGLLNQFGFPLLCISGLGVAAAAEPGEGEGAAQGLPQGLADGELHVEEDEPQLIPHGEF